MKFSKKFIEDLHKIGEWAFIEKNQWIGKLVPDIIVDNLQKRGITPDDLEGVVCLSVEEAKEFKSYFDFVCNGMSISDSMWGEVHYLRNKIWGALNRSEQAESKE